MGLFDLLFGKKNDAPEQREEAAAASHGSAAPPGFDPEFISRLTQEHRLLVALFLDIKKAHLAHDFAALKTALQEFQLGLNIHLAVENSKFYAYLRRSLKRGSAEHDTMNVFFDEMQEIGKVVTQFLRKYLEAEFTTETRRAFGDELEAIGAALVSRIDREEETLYKLYQPG